MGEDLALEAGKRGERADHNAARAIEQVTVGHRCVCAQHQFAASLGLMSEVLRMTKWETTDPVAASDARMSA